VVLAGSAISVPWWFPVLLVPGPGELFLASHEVFGPTFSAEQRNETLAAYRIRGTRAALLHYARRSPLEASGLWSAVGAVRAKVLQLHGTLDEEVPFSAAGRLQTGLRDSRLVPIEGASHFLMFDAPERFASEVEAFLPTL
jgi:pimeloyl-ACP methyl ester carboxylesterase